MNQTFGCIIVYKEKKFLLKDRISSVISDIGLKGLKKDSVSYKLEDYLLSNNIYNNRIFVTEINNLFVLLGHPLYFLINEETLGSVKQAKRTLFHFTQHGKSREYGYKFYYKGELCTHEICFGENADLYHRNRIQNGEHLPQSMDRDTALDRFANEKQIPKSLITTLRISLPRRGRSSLYFHAEKQQWIYGKWTFEKKSDGLNMLVFQELASQGHKRGKPFVIDSDAVEKGLLIKWEQLFYEWHHRAIQGILGFRFDDPKDYPKNLKMTTYEVPT